MQNQVYNFILCANDILNHVLPLGALFCLLCFTKKRGRFLNIILYSLLVVFV